jgi:nicotinamidase-related amidase
MVANVIRLCQTASMLEIPVILSEHYNKGLGATIPEIAKHLPDYTKAMDKITFSCCTAPGFERNISAHPDRRQLVVVGMEAHICIVQTVSGLQRWGYQVFVPEDAIISRKPALKANVVARMRHSGIQVVCTESVGFEWIGDSSQPCFREVWSLFKESDRPA